MAAPPYPGPVVVNAEPAAEGALEPAKAKGDDASAHDDDHDDGAMWETASLFEEILDEAEAFEYSANGGLGPACDGLVPVAPR